MAFEILYLDSSEQLFDNISVLSYEYQDILLNCGDSVSPCNLQDLRT
jgi:hypothetical protein